MPSSVFQLVLKPPDIDQGIDQKLIDTIVEAGCVAIEVGLSTHGSCDRGDISVDTHVKNHITFTVTGASSRLIKSLPDKQRKGLFAIFQNRLRLVITSIPTSISYKP